MERGYIQIYTGDGKGKTTAALGLSLRAICAGKTVFFGQFLKGMDYSELKIPELLDGFSLKQFGQATFVKGALSKTDRKKAESGLKEIKRILEEGIFDVVVLDEINGAIDLGIFSVDEIIGVLNQKSKSVEVILTGRNAKPELIEYADLVTEMKEIKHYYQKGIQARIGIEK